MVNLAIDQAARSVDEARAELDDFRACFPRFDRCGEELLSRFLHPDYVALLMKAYRLV